ICAGGFDPFGLIHSTAISPACQNYMTTTAHSTERLTQTNLQGVVQAALFSLPAGDVVAALLADHRRNTYSYHPDSQLAAQNIGELFAADSGSQIAFGTPPGAIGDPCDIRSSARTGANGARVRALCLAQGIPAAVIDSYTFPTTATAGDTRGNPNLQPETAST